MASNYLGPVDMGAKELISFLVAKRMCSKDNVLVALSMINDMSYAEIEKTTGISRYILKGTIEKAIFKYGNSRASTEAIVKKLSKMLLEANINRVIIKKDGLYMCTVCNIYLLNSFPEDHLCKKHKDLLDVETKKAIEHVRRTISTERPGRAVQLANPT
jgi:hypothetical protein